MSLIKTAIALMLMISGSASFAADDSSNTNSSNSMSDSSASSGPCSSDRQQYCPNLTWGKGLGECLMDHKSQLSPACKQRVASVSKETKEMRKACKNDVKQFCSSVQPGHGNIAACLKDNMDQLSSQCKSQMQAVHNANMNKSGNS